MHLIDPERPTEHSIFNVPADSPGDYIQHLEWSPNSCSRALLIVNAFGRASIWSQLIQGGANVARTCNRWTCEYEWRHEQSISNPPHLIGGRQPLPLAMPYWRRSIYLTGLVLPVTTPYQGC